MLLHTAENRWQAFGYHILLSFLLFILMCGIIVFFWYPGVLFTTEGGWQGVRLIASIDFIIGPILTLMIYKKGKKGLILDLTLIGLLQLTCLTYGMHTVYKDKPVVVAYGDGTFYIIPKVRFESRSIDISNNSILNTKKPVWVNIQLPTDPYEKLLVKQKHYPALETAIDLYEPFEHVLPSLKQQGISIEELPDHIRVPDQYNQAKYRVFRVFSRYGLYAILTDSETGKLVKVLSKLDPLAVGFEFVPD